MMAIRARTAAHRMKVMDDDARDAAIEAAGDVVIDRRAYFAERQKQRELARAYRRPAPPRGAA